MVAHGGYRWLPERAGPGLRIGPRRAGAAHNGGPIVTKCDQSAPGRGDFACGAPNIDTESGVAEHFCLTVWAPMEDTSAASPLPLVAVGVADDLGERAWGECKLMHVCGTPCKPACPSMCT